MQENLKPSQIVDKMIEIFSTPGKWTQGEFAKNAEGLNVRPRGEGCTATCFCILGALSNITGCNPYTELEPSNTVYRALVKEVSRLTNDRRTVESWNDDKTRNVDEVIDLLKVVSNQLAS